MVVTTSFQLMEHILLISIVPSVSLVLVPEVCYRKTSIKI